MRLLLWLVALFLIGLGLLEWLSGSFWLGAALIVGGLAVGPAGWSLFYRNRD